MPKSSLAYLISTACSIMSISTECFNTSDHTCSCHFHNSGISQTLQEMEFERGIWSAAMDGDVGRVKKLLGCGTTPSAPDSAGYTALVGVSSLGVNY